MQLNVRQTGHYLDFPSSSFLLMVPNGNLKKFLSFYKHYFFTFSEGAKIAKKAAKSAKQAFREDRDNHNGWWNVKEFKEIVGPIAIEIGDHCYVKALDDGSFTIGKLRRG